MALPLNLAHKRVMALAMSARPLGFWPNRAARCDSVSVLSAARVCFSQRSKHRQYRIALEFGAMRARIAYERLNELQRRRLLRRTSAHNPLLFRIGEHREVLHRLHISP